MDDKPDDEIKHGSIHKSKMINDYEQRTQHRLIAIEPLLTCESHFFFFVLHRDGSSGCIVLVYKIMFVITRTSLKCISYHL
jgi:hypothetical protein